MFEEKKLTNLERIEQSDKRMLRSAVELILEKGTEKTTLKEVGEKAGYSRGLAGYRFGSKSSLFAFVLTKLHRYWLFYLKEATSGKTGLSAITSCTQVHFHVLNENYDNVKVFYILWFEALGDYAQLKKIVLDINTERDESIKQWILNDVSLANSHEDATMLASQYNCMINGIVYQYLVGSDSTHVNSEKLKNLHDSLNKTMSLLLK
jgi:AcrR family transcriptional regulator